MLKTFRNAWKVEELRKKILFTLFILVIFRLGAALPVPFIDAGALESWFGSEAVQGSMFNYLDMLTGGSFSQATVFALSVTPYINASIIMQLLTIAIPALERLSKEGGEEGRAAINRITRYVTTGIAALLGVMYYFLLRNQNALSDTGVFAALVIILTFTAGSMLITWLGEQIDTHGIGNGISMLIFAGIVSRLSTLPGQVVSYHQYAQALRQFSQPWFQIYVFLVLAAILSIVSVFFVVYITNAERRIPVMYAKRVVGRKQYGGQATHIPMKVNMSGVLPVIFASSIVSLPATILTFFPALAEKKVIGPILSFFDMNGWGYALVYAILIFAFNYFYVAIQYNPVEIANNLRRNGGQIPGVRPGKYTSDFITHALGKITFVGGIFLVLLATLPIIMGNLTGIQMQLAGTSLLIMVGVALDTCRSLESYMVMRHHKGFLE